MNLKISNLAAKLSSLFFIHSQEEAAQIAYNIIKNDLEILSFRIDMSRQFCGNPNMDKDIQRHVANALAEEILKNPKLLNEVATENGSILTRTFKIVVLK